MGDLKSLTAFLRLILEDSGIKCGTSTIRDWQTVSERFEHEGFSFFTITLSDFGKDFEKSLDLGRVAPNSFRSFSRHGGLPRFLGGFLELVFDRKTGRLLSEPSIVAIKAVRQFSLMSAKIGMECTEKRTRAAMARFVECEQEVRESDARLSTERLESFKRIGLLLWADFFSNIENRIYSDGIRPKHGPGATADKLRGNAKYCQTEWPQRLEQVFPAWEHLIPSYSFVSKLDDVSFLEPGHERPVRVIAVPKTQKTPRIIAIEPTAMQYVQQGILEEMVQEMRANDNARNFVNFDSQFPNQELAREGSLTGSLATLDLSEASDRVSYQHVRALLCRNSFLREAVDACRSRKADVLGHGVIRLSKYASMGSALCFPFEAMVFTTIIFVGIEERLNRRLTQKDIKSFWGSVRVYGDDIIVPVDVVPSVTNCLEAFGLKVNAGKSFWTGKFRESCGGDYYDGHDVTVARLREEFPTSRTDVEQILSTVALRNELYARSYPRSVAYLDRLISRIIPFPRIESDSSPVLGRVSRFVDTMRMHPDYQTPLVKGMAVRSKSPESNLDDSGALMKFFLKRSEKPFQDREHLRRAGRSGSLTLKPRWATPF